MPNILEKVSSDGAVRSLLSKMVNGQPVAILPRTSSDIVEYNGSTVEKKLNDLQEWFTNLSVLLNNAIKSICDISDNTIDRSYITERLDSVNRLITSNTANIVDIRNTIANLSYYERDDIDQKLYQFMDGVETDVGNISTILDNVSSFFEDSYYSIPDVNYRYDKIINIIDDAKNIIRNEFTDTFNQFMANVLDMVNRTMMDYTTQNEFVSSNEIIDRRINKLNDKLTTLRGDTIVMNTESISEVNQYTDKIKSDIIANTNNNLYFMRDDMNRSIENTTNVMESNFSTVLSTLSGVHSNLISKLDTIVAQLSGESQTPVVYESADEEEY